MFESDIGLHQKHRSGEDACPFNSLCGRFLLEFEAKLRANPRLGRSLLGIRYLDADDRKAMRFQARSFLERLDYGGDWSAS